MRERQSPSVLNFDGRGVQEWKLVGTVEAVQNLLKRVGHETSYVNTRFELNGAALSGNRQGLTVALAGETVVARLAVEELPQGRCQIRLVETDIQPQPGLREALEYYLSEALAELEAQGFLVPTSESDALFTDSEQSELLESLFALEAYVIARLAEQGEATRERLDALRAEFAILKEAVPKLPRQGWRRVASRVFGAFMNGALGLAAKAILLQVMDEFASRWGVEQLPPPSGGAGGSSW